MSDNCCLDPNDNDTCNKDFEFFYITSETGLSDLDGILGMGPWDNGNGPSYMGGLISAGKLDQPVSSFKLRLNPASSDVLIGGIDKNDFVGDMTYYDIVMSKDSWWTVPLSGIWANNENIYSSGTQYAIIDTGTSLLTISHSDYNSFVDAVLKAEPTI